MFKYEVSCEKKNYQLNVSYCSRTMHLLQKSEGHFESGPSRGIKA